MIMKSVIDTFLSEKKIAIAGVSRTGKKMGNGLLKELDKLGYKVYPVNPNADEIEGRTCYRNVKDLPKDVSSLIVATRPEDAEQIAKDCLGSQVKRVWFHKGAGKGSATPEIIRFCIDNQLDYVYGFCPMMFYGSGMHHFHFWMRKKFGRMPHEYVN